MSKKVNLLVHSPKAWPRYKIDHSSPATIDHLMAEEVRVFQRPHLTLRGCHIGNLEIWGDVSVTIWTSHIGKLYVSRFSSVSGGHNYIGELSTQSTLVDLWSSYVEYSMLDLQRVYVSRGPYPTGILTSPVGAALFGWDIVNPIRIRQVFIPNDADVWYEATRVSASKAQVMGYFNLYGKPENDVTPEPGKWLEKGMYWKNGKPCVFSGFLSFHLAVEHTRYINPNQ